ncbi:MAG: nucleotidyltransferase domain-containing protein [Acidimicrobiales bacterium]
MDFAEPLQALIPGATGRVLAVLAHTSVPLSGRAIAELAGVSPAQAARVLPRLAELGLAEQWQSPPAVLYALVREHVAAEPLMALSELDDALMRRLGERISQLEHPPVAVAVYGSFARRQAHADSDIDVLVVRPTGTDEEDERWRSTVGQIRATARRLSGNRVEIMEVAQDEVRDVVHSSRPLWQSIAREARLVHGTSLEEL